MAKPNPVPDRIINRAASIRSTRDPPCTSSFPSAILLRWPGQAVPGAGPELPPAENNSQPASGATPDAAVPPPDPERGQWSTPLPPLPVHSPEPRHQPPGQFHPPPPPGAPWTGPASADLGPGDKRPEHHCASLYPAGVSPGSNLPIPSVRPLLPPVTPLHH